jgi:hypothetical protein
MAAAAAAAWERRCSPTTTFGTPAGGAGRKLRPNVRRRLVKVGLLELMLVVAVTAVTIAAPWGSATVAYVLLAMARRSRRRRRDSER